MPLTGCSCYTGAMSDVTRLIEAAAGGDRAALAELLPPAGMDYGHFCSTRSRYVPTLFAQSWPWAREPLALK